MDQKVILLMLLKNWKNFYQNKNTPKNSPQQFFYLQKEILTMVDN